MPREFRRCALAALGILALAGALSCALLAFTGSWLRLAESPRHADVIVVLAGSFERSLYAAELYHQRYAARVAISVPAREAGHQKLEAIGIVLPDAVTVHRQVLLKKGVAAEDILTFGQGSISTVQEAQVLRSLYARPGRRLLVVTSPYHARRARLIFDRVFEDTGASVTVVATPYEDYREDWWRSQDSARNTVLEIAKIAYYLAGGRFLAE